MGYFGSGRLFFLFFLSGEVSVKVKYFESTVAVDFYGGGNAWSETTPLHRAFILGVLVEG